MPSSFQRRGIGFSWGEREREAIHNTISYVSNNLEGYICLIETFLGLFLSFIGFRGTLTFFGSLRRDIDTIGSLEGTMGMTGHLHDGQGGWLNHPSSPFFF
jgi:hypothetical protein